MLPECPRHSGARLVSFAPTELFHRGTPPIPLPRVWHSHLQSGRSEHSRVSNHDTVEGQASLWIV